ncbi:hypothetical protein Pfo_003979 [Paulownia fortunei]|nr:hypothetical protein Pfo_003979 [Paulownia fortunei]
MTRKRIKHEQIPNMSKRNATFGKRADSLLKKANELSILCGVDMGIIVHKQGGENNSILWPSPAIFRERLQKFLDFPYMERTRKMVTHEKFMKQTMDTETENLSKSKKKTELKKSQQLMNELMQGKYFDELNLYQLNGLNSLADEMLKKLQKRDNELKDEQQQVQLLALPPPPPPFLSSQQHQMGGEVSTLDFGGMGAETSSQAPTLLENLKNDQWFIETMSEEQDIANILGASPNIRGAASSADGGAERPLGDMNMSSPPNNDSAP